MPRGVYKKSKEHKEKLRIVNLGKIIPLDQRNKISIKLKGRKLSEETKNKISIKLKGKIPKFIPNNKGIIRSLETRKKMSEAKKGKSVGLGRKVSLETRQKISDTRKKLKIKHSEDTKRKISESHKGEKCYRYKKDRNELVKNEKKHLDTKYKLWMLNIKKRDDWKCKLFNDDCDGRLEAHHIFNWKDYKELRYIINNGITLCAFHHPRGREEEKRMIPIFQELLSVSKE